MSYLDEVILPTKTSSAVKPAATSKNSYLDDVVVPSKDYVAPPAAPVIAKKPTLLQALGMGIKQTGTDLATAVKNDYSQIKDAFKGGIQQANQGAAEAQGTPQNPSTLLQRAEGTATFAGGLASAAGSFLAPSINPPVQFLGNAIANAPRLNPNVPTAFENYGTKYATTPPTQATPLERGVGAVANVAGAVGAVVGGFEGIKSFAEKPPVENVLQGGIEPPTSPVSKERSTIELPKQDTKQGLERLATGDVTDPKTDSVQLTSVKTPLVNDSKPTPILLNKVNYDLITNKHGQINHDNLIETAAHPTDSFLIKTKDNPDKINLVKQNPDGSINVIGANRFNGHGVVTYFEQIDPVKAERYLANLRQRGTSFDDSGGTATQLTESGTPHPSTPESSVPASLSGVRGDETTLPNTPEKSMNTTQETTPVKTGRTTQTLKPVEGTGDIKTRGLSQGVEAGAIEKKLTDTFGDLPEYKQVNMKEQAAKAADFITHFPDAAKEVALGNKAPPKGLLPESVFVAAERKALAEGDVDTLRGLANSKLSASATTMGQRIRTLGERDENSPLAAIQDIQKAREEAQARRGAPTKKAVKSTVDAIKKEIQKTAPKKQSWNEFIDEITC